MPPSYREKPKDMSPTDDSTMLAPQTGSMRIAPTKASKYPRKTETEKQKQLIRESYKLHIARVADPSQFDAFAGALTARGVQLARRTHPAVIFGDAGIIAERTHYGYFPDGAEHEPDPIKNAQRVIDVLFALGLPDTAKAPVEVMKKKWALESRSKQKMIRVTLQELDEKPLRREQQFISDYLETDVSGSLSCIIGSAPIGTARLADSISEAWPLIPNILQLSEVGIIEKHDPHRQSA